MKKIIFLTAATMLWGCGVDEGALADGEEPLGQSQHALMVTNGSFESGPSSSASYITLPAGNTSLPGWTIGGHSIDYAQTSHWLAAEGTYSIDLNGGGGPGALGQTISTTPGQWYRIGFSLAGNPNWPSPSVKTLRVWAGDTYRDFSFDITGRSATDMGWVRRFHQFQAVDYTTYISFDSSTPGVYGPAIDRIAVSPI